MMATMQALLRCSFSSFQLDLNIQVQGVVDTKMIDAGMDAAMPVMPWISFGS